MEPEEMLIFSHIIEIYYLIFMKKNYKKWVFPHALLLTEK